MSDFVHLHCHTEFSLLDGAIRLKDLCKKALEFKSPAAAITDHGNMHGAVTFYQTAKDMGIKPIVGCEFYVSPTTMDDRSARSPRDAGYHLVLLAQNLAGFKNLLKLSTIGYTQGFHYKPRIDKTILAQHTEGVIALSACIKGEINQELLKRGKDAAREMAKLYASMFPDRFYLEIQHNDLSEQAKINAFLKELSEDMHLPLVATNDCHYLNKEDAEAHDILLCIQTAACVEDEKRMRFNTKELYYRSPEEMAEAFSDVPQALENTCRIAEQVDLRLDLKSHHFPLYVPPNNMTLDQALRDMAEKGLTERLAKMTHPVDEEAYWDRLNIELDVINTMGFPGYFLIVQDFIVWAKNQGIPVGPGRGSAAGSLVAFALKITNLDPLPYDLLFERFLNIERVSMPDIDVDFCERRRTEVIKYVSEKYGRDAVAQITTFGTMKAKAVVRDVGRALGLSFGETDRIAKLIPEDLKMTIDKALDMEPEISRLMVEDPRIAKLIDVSRRLEGLARHASTHAAGVVVSDVDMVEYVPLYLGKNKEIVTQWDMKRVEKIGLIKFDFLGLKTMTVIQDALDIIQEMGHTPPDLDTLSLDDKATYELFSKGDTDGIFQVESQGMRKYLRMLKPSCFEDLIAMLALYRPGPLGSGMVDKFINRKQGLEPIEYPHPDLEETLKPTYGIIVYQEQVMKIPQILAGFSLGDGDLLRRAMGKKIAEEMAKQRDRFIEGTRKNNIDDKQANEIFDLMEEFAKYGFNKSHSAAYALISYHTAYLKAHYPVAYMAAIITSDIDNQEKVLKYIADCRDRGIEVLPPDVNKSLRHFSVSDGKIVYGLAGIKNVGDEAIREIVEHRLQDGPYLSFLDLCSRVNMRKVTKRVLEYLIKSGSLDCFGVTRNALLTGLDRVASMAQRQSADKASGMLSLLSLVPEQDKAPCSGLGLDCEEANLAEMRHEDKMAFEKEALGFYLTSHPLLAYRRDIHRLRLHSLDSIRNLEAGFAVKVAIMPAGAKVILTKKGLKMAFCRIEDLSGEGEAIVFPETYAAHKDQLALDQPLLLSGKIAKQDEEEGQPKKAKIIVEELQPLAQALGGGDEPLLVELDASHAELSSMSTLRTILERYPGSIRVHLLLHYEKARCRLKLSDDIGVGPCPDFWRDIEDWQEASTAVQSRMA
ncbi:DNA polymerase III subunit alpha [Desulfovibrio inopinatus]|uniref:DNA polymerase III subunit alpha n=1 Tax=Desulfovibrio inopinatus TaxID=102109 RepID=UPI00041AC8A2|nr:DNA polymerase III subunit alpha [Desulfovibrio inopinatus]